MKYGYARISDKSQNIDAQIDELTEHGVEEIVQEVIMGSSSSKDELDRLIDRLEPGDELVVTRHDRLGRNTLQLLMLTETLEKKNVRFRILNLDLDTRSIFGKPIIAIFSAFAEMERSILKEKQRKGIDAARKRGKHLGRKAEWTKKGLEEALKEYVKGERSVNEIAEIYQVPRSTLYYYVREAGIKR